MTDNRLPEAAVVCCTYRKPEHDNTGRLMGIAGLVTQIMSQDYAGKTVMAVVDSSAEKHPFLEQIAETLKDRFLYLHVPERNAVDPAYKTLYPQAMELLPDDEALKLPRWQFRARQMEGWQRFVPIEDDFPRPVFIGQHMFHPRPTIGMKKNVGVMALAETFGRPDVILFADDDDYKGPTYVRDLVGGIQGADFTRITKYLINIDNPKFGEPVWGIYDFPFPKDANGNYYVTDQAKNEPLYTSEILPDGTIRQNDPKKWFARAFQLAWSPMSHEGATHTYSFDMWEKGLEAFGACAPCNFGEDVIFFRQLKDHFGRDFKTQFTPVEDWNFLRTSDGTNASFVLYNKHLDAGETIPGWAAKSMDNFRSMRAFAGDRREALASLGRIYAESGQYDPAGYLRRLGAPKGTPSAGGAFAPSASPA